MQYVFQRAVHLDGKDYPRGVHEIPEKVEHLPYFLKLVGLGLICEADRVQVITPQTQKQKAEKLINKLVAKQKSKAEAQAAKADQASATPPSHDGVVTGENPDGSLNVKLNDGTEAQAPADAVVPAKDEPVGEKHKHSKKK